MFDRGIFPNVVLTVGDRRNADGTPGGKPTLTGPQRRQTIRAIREVWGATTSNGDPAIIDGLIAGIHKLNNMPAEMDWLNSGEQVKKRIFQAFHVNPIVVGEVTGANRAQAAVAEQSFLSTVVNPLGDGVTVVLNDFVAPLFGGGKGDEKAKKKDKPAGKTKLYLWIEEGQPLDDDLKLRKFQIGRQNNDVTRNEFRTEVLALPPIEDEEEVKRVPLLDTVGGGQVIVQVLSAVGMGTMGPQSAVEAFKLLFEMDDAQAEALVGDTGDLALLAPPAPAIGGAPPGRDTPPPDDDDEEDEEEKPELPDVDENAGTGKALKAAGIPMIKRSTVKANHRRQQARLEREVAGRLRPFSKASIARLLRNLHGNRTAS
jgi:hypothetical protein